VLPLALACNQPAKLPLAEGTGPAPNLPAPHKSLLPTVDIAPAKGWSEGARPVGAAGTTVTALARDLRHPRWLYVLPNGDVLVAETNAPPKPEDEKGLRGWAMKRLMKKAGSAEPSANRISLLRDADGDHVAETRTTFLEGLSSPFGMALVEIFTGLKIRKMSPTGRILGIVLSILSLFSFPLGTALGIYGLWALLSREGEMLFQDNT